jgi:hypothetical protein
MSDSLRPPGAGVVTLSLFSDGRQLSDAVPLISVNVRDRSGHGSRARVELLSDDALDQTLAPSDDGDRRATELRIAAGYDGDADTIFSVVVVRKCLRIEASGEARWSWSPRRAIRSRPRAWRPRPCCGSRGENR